MDKKTTEQLLYLSDKSYLSRTDIQFHSLASVRNWLINGNNPNYINKDGNPAWWLAMSSGIEESVDELILAGANINIKNENNTNWVMACLDYNMSLWVFQNGFKNIKIKWWEPDNFGRSPLFSEKLTPQMLHLLCSYLYGNFISWEKLKINNVYPEDFFKDKNQEIYKTLIYWKRRMTFNQPIKYRKKVD